MTKRTAEEAFRKPRRTRSLSPPTVHSRSEQRRTSTSPSRPVQSAPARLEPRGTRLDFGLCLSDDQSETVDEDEDPLLYRILTALEYARAQYAQGRPVLQTTRFRLSTREHAHPSSALTVLRQAGLEGHATRIAVDDEYEIWNIGVPRPYWVNEGAFGGLHDPQWWYGLDAAHIEAGPHGTETDVKEARAASKAAETRGNKKLEKSQRAQDIDWKLEEWHKRYKSGKKMNDSDDSDTDRSRFTPEGSNRNPTDNDDSDDESITPEKLARWKAERKSRAAAGLSTTPSRRQSAYSEDSDGYVPLSSSGKNSSASKLPRNDSGIDLKFRSQKKNSIRRSEAASESEDSGPIMPMFSKWKAAQKARDAKSCSTLLTKSRPVKSFSSEEEDVALPSQRRARSTQRRRVIVGSSADE